MSRRIVEEAIIFFLVFSEDVELKCAYPGELREEGNFQKQHIEVNFTGKSLS